MRTLSFGILALLMLGCSSDSIDKEETLTVLVQNKEIVLDNVIACAASNENDALVSVFLYPRPEATNIRYFQTMDAKVDKNDFDNYNRVDIPSTELFNGYLLKFEVEVVEEKWGIVAFEEDQKIHLSNPIRLKQLTKPTEYLPENIAVDTSSGMPMFSWQDGVYDDSIIYFHVVSDAQDNLLSGTYTFERMFTYYELDNVVLNITRTMPPDLSMDLTYQFTLMGVSEDNWVNQFSTIEFGL